MKWLNTQEAALSYLKKGFVIYPLSSPKSEGVSPGKRPLLKQWQQLEKVTENDVDKWFSNKDRFFQDCNIGLQCGKRSGVTVLDIDHELFVNELFQEIEIETLRSKRTAGRGHVYFQYNPTLPAQKHHELGVEVLSDGNNVVMPPSTHPSGDTYHWNDPDTPISKMPELFVVNLKVLVEKHKQLNNIIKKCRPCYRHYWNDETRITTGSTTRLFIGSFCSELVNLGAGLDLIQHLSKLLFKDKYDESRTITEYEGWTQKGYKPWTCEKIQNQCGTFTSCDTCKLKTSDNGKDRTYSQATALIDYTSSDDVELFHDDKGDPYARVSIDGKNKNMPVQGRDFRRWVTRRFFEDTGTAPGGDAIINALNVIEAKACHKGKEYKLHNRIANHEGKLWYDMGDGAAVKIDSEGWEIVNNPPILFKSFKHQKSHDIKKVKPAGDVKKILNFINLADDADRLLFVVYLISCFIPEIPHPIPVLHGDKGSSKSTAFKFIKEITDPSVLQIFSFPKDNTELVQKLDHHHFAPFDNVTTLSEWQSDALCRACTGEGFSKRAHYTNDEDVIYNYQRCIGLNGVNVVASKADLLDRAILLKFVRIPKERRKTEAELWEVFDEVKHEVLSGIFTILSKAIKIKPDIQLTELPRMADFMLWGCAIAEVMGDGQQTFYNAYNSNIQSQNKEALEASPVGELITMFMEDKVSWSGRASELLPALEGIAAEYRINTKARGFPKAANALTRRINEIQSNLMDEGIVFEVKVTNKYSVLSLLKVSGNTTTTTTPPLPDTREVIESGGRVRKYHHHTTTVNTSGGNAESNSSITPPIPQPQNPDASVVGGGSGDGGDISRHTLGADLCDLCSKPLNGHETVQGVPGQGEIHKSCYSLPLKVTILKYLPSFMCVDNKLYGPCQVGDVITLPAINASGLVLQKVAKRVL